MFSELAQIALVAARLGQFQQLLKTRVILIFNVTRPNAITYTKRRTRNNWRDFLRTWNAIIYSYLLVYFFLHVNLTIQTIDLAIPTSFI